MRILIAHNEYRYRGGEDSVVDAEATLLRDHGHEVEIYRRNKNSIVSRAIFAAHMTYMFATIINDI